MTCQKHEKNNTSSCDLDAESTKIRQNPKYPPKRPVPLFPYNSEMYKGEGEMGNARTLNCSTKILGNQSTKWGHIEFMNETLWMEQ